MAFKKQSDTSRKIAKPKAPKTLVGLQPKGGGRARGTDTFGPIRTYDETVVPKPNIIPKAGNDTAPNKGAWTSMLDNIATTGRSTGGDYSTYGDLNPGAGTSGDFASRYTPAGINEMYQHPEVLAADLLGLSGITNEQMIDQFGSLADLGYALQLVMQGSPGGTDQTNFIADYLTQMMTPGAQAPDYNDLVNMLWDPGGNMELSRYVDNADPQAINNLILSLLQATTSNPYYINAEKGALNQQQRDYYSSNFSNPTGPTSGGYADYLRGGGIPGVTR